jgi:hypothetical protein
MMRRRLYQIPGVVSDRAWIPAKGGAEPGNDGVKASIPKTVVPAEAGIHTPCALVVLAGIGKLMNSKVI